MKPLIAKFAKRPKTTVFRTAIPKLSANVKETTPSPKSQKRDNIFSKSRDTREDRGSRQMKTSHSSRTLSHGK
jgi:hypothetical protein